MRIPFFLILAAGAALANDPAMPAKGLVLDLDAAKGVTLEDGNKVSAWTNQAPDTKAKSFVSRNQGRTEAGSGRPELRAGAAEIAGKPALIFRQQELTCADEDTFDGLTTGKGHTWLALIAVYPQRAGLKDVNSFFGNLRNGGNYEGVWGCLNDDNTPWYGARNGISFGRFDTNNPQLRGPRLEPGSFHFLAGRLAAGTGIQRLEFFVDGSRPAASADFPVNPKANPSRMSVGQERDAIEHPGVESFDGEIARLLIWERPLSDAELDAALKALESVYHPK